MWTKNRTFRGRRRSIEFLRKTWPEATCGRVKLMRITQMNNISLCLSEEKLISHVKKKYIYIHSNRNAVLGWPCERLLAYEKFNVTLETARVVVCSATGSQGPPTPDTSGRDTVKLGVRLNIKKKNKFFSGDAFYVIPRLRSQLLLDPLQEHKVTLSQVHKCTRPHLRDCHSTCWRTYGTECTHETARHNITRRTDALRTSGGSLQNVPHLVCSSNTGYSLRTGELYSTTVTSESTAHSFRRLPKSKVYKLQFSVIPGSNVCLATDGKRRW